MTSILSILGLEKESMDSIENRLKTLVYWPVDFMSAEELAESGFYYDGIFDKTDTVHCYSCKISLSDWKAGHIANERHKKYNQYCTHLRQVNADPVYPDYKSIFDRHRSFMDWNIQQKITAESLYNAGFFYEGEGDICCCYHCGKRVNKWPENSNPLEIHKTVSPYCKFLTTVNDSDEEDSNHNSHSDSKSDSNSECDSEWDSFDVSKNLSNLNIDDNNCCICFENPKNAALNPCGHTFCYECSKNFEICPTCRKKVETNLKIYL